MYLPEAVPGAVPGAVGAWLCPGLALAWVWIGPACPGFALSWRQHHHDLAALEAGILLDLGEVGGIVLHAVEQPVAKLLVCQLAATEAKGDLDLVALLE